MDAAFGVVPDRDISSEVCQPVAGRSVAWRQRGAGGIAVAMGERDMPADVHLPGPAALALWLERRLAA